MPPELSKHETELIYWAFEKNKKFSDLYANRDKVSIYIWFAYIDILKKIQDLPIHGIQDKLSDINSNSSRLIPTLSEMKASKVFAERGFNVELLTDNDTRFTDKKGKITTKSPDLLISREDSTLLVEVANMSRDDSHFLLYQKLAPLVRELNFVVSISFTYSQDLSKIALKGDERSIQKELFNEFAAKLHQHLESINQNQLPYEFSIDDSKISVKQAKSGTGRIDNISWIKVPHNDYIKHIQQTIFKKASKRKSFKDEFLKQPFLVFLDTQDPEIQEKMFSALYGSLVLSDWIEPNEITSEQQVFYPECVMDQLQGNEKEFLLKLGFDSQRRSYIDKCGYFVTEESVRKNVTGVITMFNDELECFPNPFCDELIHLPNLPEYLDIPLKSFAVGAAG
jgi:hypothetical protein